MEAKHTPRPWRIGKSDDVVVADEPVLGMPGSDDIEYYGGHLIAESVVPANAAFIVRACNAHDELVKALQLVLAGLANGSVKSKPIMDFSDANAESLEIVSLSSIVSAALAKASK